MFKKFAAFASVFVFFLFVTFVYSQNSNVTATSPSSPGNGEPKTVPTPTPRRSPRPQNANKPAKPVETDSLPPDEIQAKSTVRGRVYYSDTGRPVKRASIMLVGKSGGGREAGGMTDGDGNFEIKNLAAGTYFPMINSPGIVSFFSSIDFNLAKSDESQMIEEATQGVEQITVNGINDIDVQIPAYRGGAISGRVLYANGDPAIGVSVQILRKKDGEFIPTVTNFSSIFLGMMAGGNGNGGSQTDDRGVYRFAALPAGEYIVKATENATHGDSKDNGNRGMESMIFGSLFGGNSFLTAYFPDVFEAKKAQVINIDLGQEQTEINVILPDLQLRTISGKIVTAKDKAPWNANITIDRIEDEDTLIAELPTEFGRAMKQSTQTNDAGIFKFRELPPGKYRLTVEPENIEDAEEVAPATALNSNRVPNPPSRSTPKPRFAKRTFEFTIDDRDVDDMVIEVGFGAFLSGTVFMENSPEMPMIVSIEAANKKLGLVDTATIPNYLDPSNPAGNKYKHNFVFANVATGKIELSINSITDEYYVKSMRSGTTDLLTNPIELSEGEAISNVQIILAKDFGSVNGKAVTETNEAAKGIQVSIFPTDSARRKMPNSSEVAFTNESGEFTEKLAPGEYAFIILGKQDTAKKGEAWEKWLDEAIKEAPKVKIEAGKSASVSVKAVKK